MKSTIETYQARRFGAKLTVAKNDAQMPAEGVLAAPKSASRNAGASLSKLFTTGALVCTLAMSTVSLAACGVSTNPGGSETGGYAQIPNPIHDCNDLSDAEALTGFTMTLPSEVAGYPTQQIQTIESDIIQVVYHSTQPESSELSDRVIIRKGKGSEDISGDYNTYDTIAIASLASGIDVTLKGNGDKFYLATWNTGDFSYSISYDAPTTQQNLCALAEQVN